MKENTDLLAKKLGKKIKDAQEYKGVSEKDLPSGYVTIPLSSCGNVFAPGFVYARSYKTIDIAHLSLLRRDQLPENNIRVIKDVVFQDINPGDWHLNEVVEFMLKHYSLFSGTSLKDVPWPVNDEDIKAIKQSGEEMYEAWVAGEYVPMVDIPLDKISYKELDKPLNTFTMETEEGVFVFRAPKFKDGITLKTYIQAEFKAEDERFKKMAEEVGGVDFLSEQALDEYREHTANKVHLSSAVNLALLLKSVDGKEIEDIDEALKIILEDSRFDYDLSVAVKNNCDTLADMFGVIPDIKLPNPLTGKLETRRFEFRLYDIISSLHKKRSNKYNVTFG